MGGGGGGGGEKQVQDRLLHASTVLGSRPDPSGWVWLRKTS